VNRTSAFALFLNVNPMSVFASDFADLGWSRLCGRLVSPVPSVRWKTDSCMCSLRYGAFELPQGPRLAPGLVTRFAPEGGLSHPDPRTDLVSSWQHLEGEPKKIHARKGKKVPRQFDCGIARVGTKMIASPYIGWPAIVGLKFLDVLIAERWAKPSFRQQTNTRGISTSMAFHVVLRLFRQTIAAIFSALRATRPWSPDVPRKPARIGAGRSSRPRFRCRECRHLSALTACRAIAAEAVRNAARASVPRFRSG
jgi:hypothetical protein